MRDINIKRGFDYGEILFTGTCNFRCFYCLGHEMSDSAKIDNSAHEHFSKWKNFKEYLDRLQSNNVKTIYLSSTNSEPMLYPYLGQLIDYLQKLYGFNVGIRTNGSIDTEICNELNEEISLSLQSLNKDTFKKITGVDMNFDFLENLGKIKSKNLRVTIAVNRYNYKEIFDMIEVLRNYKNIKYVQLRKCYKYYNTDIKPDIDAFEYVMQELRKFSVKGNYKESIIYDVHGLSVSVWETVFKSESLQTFNYWTNGVMTSNNLLVEGYKDECNKH